MAGGCEWTALSAYTWSGVLKINAALFAVVRSVVRMLSWMTNFGGGGVGRSCSRKRKPTLTEEEDNDSDWDGGSQNSDKNTFDAGTVFKQLEVSHESAGHKHTRHTWPVQRLLGDFTPSSTASRIVLRVPHLSDGSNCRTLDYVIPDLQLLLWPKPDSPSQSPLIYELCGALQEGKKPLLVRKFVDGSPRWSDQSDGGHEREVNSLDSALTELLQMQNPRLLDTHEENQALLELCQAELFVYISSEEFQKGTNGVIRELNSKVQRVGIEWHSNSCYLDSTLYCMFAETHIFDNIFIGEIPNKGKSKRAKTEENARPLSQNVRHSLAKVAAALRDGYCPSELTTEFRDALGAVNPRISNGSMMDVDEFVGSFFGQALSLDHFIKYSAGTGNFLHQLIIIPRLVPTFGQHRLASLQTLLEESMRIQGLKFAQTPSPALLIKMPRSNGRLVGYDGICPDLRLDIGPLLENGDDDDNTQNTIMHLVGVVVIKHAHYTCFVRKADLSSDWLYADSLGPSVRELEDFGTKIQKIGRSSPCTRALETSSSDLQRLITDIHFCFYAKILSKGSIYS